MLERFRGKERGEPEVVMRFPAGVDAGLALALFETRRALLGLAEAEAGGAVG